MPTIHVAVRLEPDQIARVDALLPTFTTRWRKATRSEVLRALILESLERTEAEQKAAASSKPAAKPRKRGAK